MDLLPGQSNLLELYLFIIDLLSEKSKIMKKIFLFIVFLLNNILNAQQAGNLDISFAINGKGSTNLYIDGANVLIRSQAIQSDGKIVLAGSISYDGLNPKGFLIRLNSDGTTDMSFLGTGTFSSSSDSYFSVVKIGVDNKLLVGGDNTLTRLHSDGNFDLSFNNIGSIAQYVVDLEIQTDGKILVLGGAVDSIGYPICALRRFTENGVVDNTFGTNGKIVFGIGQSRPLSILLQSDQKILVGYNFSQSPGVWGGYKFFRCDNNGTNAITISYSESNPASSSLTAFAIQPDSKILMSNSQGICRFNSNLSIDLSFGINGVVSNISSNLDKSYFVKIQVQTDNKIVVVSNNFTNYLINNNTTANVLVTRYNYDGTFDTSFAQNGTFIIPSASTVNAGKAVGLFDNKILVCDSYNSSTISKINTNGDLDLNFGYLGQKIITIPTEKDDVSIKSVLQSDGKLLIFGYSGTGYNRKTVIVRYNLDGNIDTSFAQQGKFSFPAVEPIDLGLQSDNKILFCYKSSSFGFEATKIIRLDTNGVIDVFFGVNGIQELVIPESTSRFIIKKFKILQDNKIMILGFYDYILNGIYEPTVLMKLNSNGTLDTTFNISGCTILNIYPDAQDYGSETFSSINIQNDGKIIIGGSVYYYNRHRNLLARFNSDGTFDNSFGVNGVSLMSSYPSINTPYGAKYEIDVIDFQNDNKIIINTKVSEYSNLVSNKFLIARINLDGSLDTSFGINGIVQTDIENSCNSNSLKVLPNQKIIVSGYSVGSNKNFALAAYNSDGVLDSSFGNQGKVFTSFNNNNAISNSLLLTNDNNVILTGTVVNPLFGNNDFAFAKYFLDNNLGVKDVQNNKFSSFYPNPSIDKIYFNQNVKFVSIFSLDNKLINTKFENNDIDISSFSKGIYLVRIIDHDGKIFNEKLIKN